MSTPQAPCACLQIGLLSRVQLIMQSSRGVVLPYNLKKLESVQNAEY